MMQKFIILILTAVIIPFLAWGSSALVSHSNSIARLEEREKSTREIVIEVRSDVKEIKRYILNEK